jgi:hypothetical protein
MLDTLKQERLDQYETESKCDYELEKDAQKPVTGIKKGSCAAHLHSQPFPTRPDLTASVCVDLFSEVLIQIFP